MSCGLDGVNRQLNGIPPPPNRGRNFISFSAAIILARIKQKSLQKIRRGSLLGWRQLALRARPKRGSIIHKDDVPAFNCHAVPFYAQKLYLGNIFKASAMSSLVGVS